MGLCLPRVVVKQEHEEEVASAGLVVGERYQQRESNLIPTSTSAPHTKTHDNT